MLYDAPLLYRLLGSIEAGRLTLVCGAGLSIPPPSSLMSAISVARFCYDRYKAITVLPPEMRNDIDLLAGHFLASKEFESVFIGHLVPWDDLAGR